MSDTYKDTDFVYVDAEKRCVISLVEFDKNGNPIPKEKEIVATPKNPKAIKRKGARKYYYPWGSYKTMKRIYKLEGKERESENYKTLDDALELSSKEVFWN